MPTVEQPQSEDKAHLFPPIATDEKNKSAVESQLLTSKLPQLITSLTELGYLLREKGERKNGNEVFKRCAECISIAQGGAVLYDALQLFFTLEFTYAIQLLCVSGFASPLSATKKEKNPEQEQEQKEVDKSGDQKKSAEATAELSDSFVADIWFGNQIDFLTGLNYVLAIVYKKLITNEAKDRAAFIEAVRKKKESESANLAPQFAGTVVDARSALRTTIAPSPVTSPRHFYHWLLLFGYFIGSLLIDICEIIDMLGRWISAAWVIGLLATIIGVSVCYLNYKAIKRIVPQNISDFFNFFTLANTWRRFLRLLDDFWNNWSLGKKLIRVPFGIMVIGAGVMLGLMTFYYASDILMGLAFLAAVNPYFATGLAAIVAFFMFVSVTILFLEGLNYFANGSWVHKISRYWEKLGENYGRGRWLWLVLAIMLSVLAIFGLVCLTIIAKNDIADLMINQLGVGESAGNTAAVAIGMVAGIGGQVIFSTGTVFEFIMQHAAVGTDGKELTTGEKISQAIFIVGCLSEFGICMHGGSIISPELVIQAVAAVSMSMDEYFQTVLDGQSEGPGVGGSDKRYDINVASSGEGQSAAAEGRLLEVINLVLQNLDNLLAAGPKSSGEAEATMDEAVASSASTADAVPNSTVVTTSQPALTDVSYSAASTVSESQKLIAVAPEDKAKYEVFSQLQSLRTQLNNCKALFFPPPPRSEQPVLAKQPSQPSPV